MNLNTSLSSLDTWCNKTITNSLLGRLISFISSLISSCTQNKINSFLSKLLIFSICILFISLSLPKFANDRFGIGLIIIFCFFIFLFYVFSNKHLIFTFNTIDFCILSFLAIAVVSTFSSYFFKESFIGLLKYIVFFLWYFMIKAIILNCSKKTFLNLWGVLCLCGIITAIIGIYQYIIGVEPLATWEDPSQENLHTRVYSTLGNPNLLAGYLLLFLPINLILTFEYKNNFLKLFSLAGAALILICLILTGSRGGYIGLIFSFLLSILVLFNYFIFQKNKKSTITLSLLAITALILFLTFMFPVIGERMLTIFTFREHSSNNYRLNVWIACLKMLKDNWLFGIGPGNNTFRLAYGLYMISGFDALAAYNIILETAIETGIIGALVFISIFLLAFFKLHYLFWQKKSFFALAVFISLISILTHGMVDTVFFRPQIFVPFWFLLASLGKIESKEGTSS